MGCVKRIRDVGGAGKHRENKEGTNNGVEEAMGEEKKKYREMEKKGLWSRTGKKGKRQKRQGMKGKVWLEGKRVGRKG